MNRFWYFMLFLVFASGEVAAKECVTLSEEIPLSVVTGDGDGLTCVNVPNAYGSSEMKYIAVNSSFYRPEVSYRASREELINITPQPDVPVTKSYIYGRSGAQFKLYVGDSPLKFKTTNFERVPHTITFVLTYQNGAPFVLVAIDAVTKMSGVSSSSSLYNQQISTFDNFSSNLNTSASTTTSGCDETNRSPTYMPPSANLNNNIYVTRQIAAMASNEVGGDSIKYWWFYTQVRNGATWDYKQLDRTKYQEFGNYNYGAVGAALGIPREILLRAAGWAQVRAGTSEEEWGHYLGSAPYGDDPVDAAWIEQGINYYEDVLQDKTTAEIGEIASLRSDSCRARNAENQTRSGRDDSFIENGGNGLYKIPLETRDIYVCFTYECRTPNVYMTDLEREEDKDR